MAKVKAWKDGAAGAPTYPSDFTVVKKAVLQKTNLTNNNNKYCAIEFHKAGHDYRVFTSWSSPPDGG